MSFAAYRQMLDAATYGARLTGLLDEPSYRAALADSRTLRATLGGVGMPVAVTLDHGTALGYDVQRCQRIVEGRGLGDAWVWALPAPLTAEGGPVLADWLNAGGQRCLFSSLSMHDDPAGDVAAVIAARADSAQIVELRDERAAPGRDTPTLTLYALEVRPQEPSGRTLSTAGMYEAYQAQPTGRSGVQSGTSAMWGADLTEQQVEEYWSLYERRFQWLGDAHPASMEDTRTSFIELLTAPGMLTVAHYEDDLKCFTYFSDDLAAAYWLRGAFYTEKAGGWDGAHLFFPGIVSESVGMNYAAGVLALVVDLGADLGANARVTFETTNLSEGYIPKIVSRQIDANPRLNGSEPILLDRTSYALTAVRA